VGDECGGRFEPWVSWKRAEIWSRPGGNSSSLHCSLELTSQFFSHARNFVDCIRSRQAPVSPLEAAIRSDTVSLLTDIAIRGGRAVRWDPTTETILGDDEAARLLDRPVRAKWDLLAGNAERAAAPKG